MITQKEAGKKKELPEGMKEKKVLFRLVAVLIGVFILLGGLFATKTALDIFSEEDAEVEVSSGVAEEGATQSQSASGTTAAPSGSTGTTTPSTTTSTGTTPSTSTGTSGTSGGTAPAPSTSGTLPAAGADEEEPAPDEEEPAAEEPAPPATPTTETNCNNGIDDDADGNMDYADRDCIGSTNGCPVVGGVQTQVVWSYVPEEDPAGIPSRRGCCASAQCRRANGACVSFDMLAGSDFNCGIGNNWDRCGPEGDPRYNKHAGDRSDISGPAIGGEYICNGAAWVREYPETSCRDGADNDGDGRADSSDADCLGKLCEPAPSKKVWVRTYSLRYQSGVTPRWRIYASGFSYNGLSVAEAGIGGVTACCRADQCYSQSDGCVNSNVDDGEAILCWKMGSEEPSNSIGGGASARYKNSFLRCNEDSHFARVSDGTNYWDCDGALWYRGSWS